MFAPYRERALPLRRAPEALDPPSDELGMRVDDVESAKGIVVGGRGPAMTLDPAEIRGASSRAALLLTTRTS